MVDQLDYQELNSLVKHFLEFNGLKDSVNVFEHEIRSKVLQNQAKVTSTDEGTASRPAKSRQQRDPSANELLNILKVNKVPQSEQDLRQMPAIYAKFVEDKTQSEREAAEAGAQAQSTQTSTQVVTEKDIKQLQRQSGSVLQSARQIFSIAINCLQQLHNIKDGNSMTENLGETIDNYKVQLSKYNQILSSEGRCDRSELFSEQVMGEHKQRLIQAKMSNDTHSIIEVLLSLRVNALQIAPELRKNLVYEIIRNDVFLLSSRAKNQFLLELMAIEDQSLRHALLSLISIVASTLKGVEYLLVNDQMIITTLIQILSRLSDSQDGSVNQRFLVAILQKVSIKSDSIPILVDMRLIQFILELVTRAMRKEIDAGLTFALDFGTALLANILHAQSTQDFLLEQRNQALLTQTTEKLLRLINERAMPTSTLMHILICLSYLNKEAFSAIAERECQFSSRIEEFVTEYSKKPVVDNENDEIDKRTVLDLCAHMFHPKDFSGNDLSQSLDYNDMRPDDKIREFENEQGDLIFECFQDEQTMFE